jgi:hypothetical protein
MRALQDQLQYQYQYQLRAANLQRHPCHHPFSFLLVLWICRQEKEAGLKNKQSIFFGWKSHSVQTGSDSGVLFVLPQLGVWEEEKVVDPAVTEEMAWLLLVDLEQPEKLLPPLVQQWRLESH